MKKNIILAALMLAIVGQVTAMRREDVQDEAPRVRRMGGYKPVGTKRPGAVNRPALVNRPVPASQQRPIRRDVPFAQRERVQVQPAVAPVTEAIVVPIPDQQLKEECGICLDAQTGKHTPCCNQAICPQCWEQSLESTEGTCPFCRAEGQGRALQGK